MTWGAFWGIVFLLSLVMFAVLAIYVTFAGFADARAMFRRLRNENPQAKSVKDE